MDTINKLLADLSRARIYNNSNVLTAEQKYDLIFSLHIYDTAQRCSLPFPDYYDPDTTYEEDVAAYMRALSQLEELLCQQWTLLLNTTSSDS